MYALGVCQFRRVEDEMIMSRTSKRTLWIALQAALPGRTAAASSGVAASSGAPHAAGRENCVSEGQGGR